MRGREKVPSRGVLDKSCQNDASPARHMLDLADVNEGLAASERRPNAVGQRRPSTWRSLPDQVFTNRRSLGEKVIICTFRISGEGLEPPRACLGKAT